MENELERCKGVPSADTLKRAKEMCFADSYIGTLCGMKQAEVKACGRSTASSPPSRWWTPAPPSSTRRPPTTTPPTTGENEAVETSDRKKVLVLGSGPSASARASSLTTVPSTPCGPSSAWL